MGISETCLTKVDVERQVDVVGHVEPAERGAWLLVASKRRSRRGGVKTIETKSTGSLQGRELLTLWVYMGLPYGLEAQHRNLSAGVFECSRWWRVATYTLMLRHAAPVIHYREEIICRMSSKVEPASSR